MSASEGDSTCGLPGGSDCVAFATPSTTMGDNVLFYVHVFKPFYDIDDPHAALDVVDGNPAKEVATFLELYKK